MLKHLDVADPDEPRIDAVFRGAREVGSAIMTAISATIITSLPVFTVTRAEGKQFIPLDITKTFVLLGAIFLALTAMA